MNLKREVGDRLKEGTDLSRYESLIDEYEPGARTQHLDQLFENLRIPLVDLIKRIGISNQKPQPQSISSKSTDRKTKRIEPNGG